MAVIETGADESTVQIHSLSGFLCGNFCIGTYGSKLAVFYDESLLQRQVAGIDTAVYISGFHPDSSFFLIVSEKT